MQAFEVWGDLPGELNHQILESVYLNQKKLYRSVVQEMATQLRRRVAMIQKMPRLERHNLFQPLLAQPQFGTIGQNLLMNWLGSERVAMLTLFLDELGIENDGEGYATAFPKTIEQDVLKKGVEALYGAYADDEVTFYLRTLDSLTGVTWDGLDELVRPFSEDEADGGGKKEDGEAG